MTAARVHDVVVVGAGFAGLAASLALSEAGIDDHLVLEAAAEVGGTWRDNRYPGVACDIPAPQYTLSRRRRSRWTAPFAPGAEIRDYLRDIAAEPGVAERLRTSTPLSSAAWDEAAGLWRITTPRGLLATRALILCAGRFGSPLVPDVPGYGSFGGDIVHSARWRDDAAIDGADVVVVGTGASAVQIVPRLAGRAARLTVLQRRAPWILPRTVGTGEDGAPATPPGSALLAQDAAFPRRLRGSTAQRAVADAARAHRERQLSSPLLRSALEPRDEAGCRRVLFSDDFYPALERADVALEPSGLAAIGRDGVVTAAGRTIPADTIVLATGFDVRAQPYAPLITGGRGTTLAESWSDGMRSVGGIAVPGFPGMFVVNGPQGTLGHGSALLAIEAQLDGIVRLLLGTRGPVRASDRDARAWRERVHSLAGRTVWSGGCRSWYLDADGSPGLLWPGRAAELRDHLDDAVATLRASSLAAEPPTLSHSSPSPAPDATGRPPQIGQRP